MTHLTRRELQDFWDHGRASDRERVVGHLAACDECGALYGEVMDVQASPTSAVARPELVDRAYRAYRSRARARARAWGRRLARRWPGVLAGAAAAGLVGLLLPALRDPAPPPDPEPIRGASLQALAPVGRVDPPVQFRWASPVSASRFVVEVRDARRRLLFEIPARAEWIDLPPESVRRLRPDEAYSWEVVAFGPADQEIMRSRPVTFSVSAGRP